VQCINCDQRKMMGVRSWGGFGAGKEVLIRREVYLTTWKTDEQLRTGGGREEIYVRREKK